MEDCRPGGVTPRHPPLRGSRVPISGFSNLFSQSLYPDLHAQPEPDVMYDLCKAFSPALVMESLRDRKVRLHREHPPSASRPSPGHHGHFTGFASVPAFPLPVPLSFPQRSCGSHGDRTQYISRATCGAAQTRHRCAQVSPG